MEEAKMVPTKVRAPKLEEIMPWITSGKEYGVIDGKKGGGDFTIIDDDGNEIICLLNNCAHLGGGDWIVTEKENN